jgi:hypothetical protein
MALESLEFDNINLIKRLAFDGAKSFTSRSCGERSNPSPVRDDHNRRRRMQRGMRGNCWLSSAIPRPRGATPNDTGTTASSTPWRLFINVHSPSPQASSQHWQLSFMSAFRYYTHLGAISIVSFDARQRRIPRSVHGLIALGLCRSSMSSLAFCLFLRDVPALGS